MGHRAPKIALLITLVSSLALGAGYERTLSWSGKHTGSAGIGSPFGGAESLFFNPAGLASVQGTELSLNLSPTLIQSRGPIQANGVIVESKSSFFPAFGVFAGHRIGEKFGVGLGAYSAGGARADFENLSFAPTFSTLKANAVSQITLVEYSLGVGYEVIPRLRIGASWRVLQVSGKVQLPVVIPNGTAPGAPSLAAVNLDELKQTRFNGFRFGVQYDAPGWGLGASVRNAVNFNLKGNSSAVAQAPQPLPQGETTLSGGDVSVGNQFPLQAKLGGYADFCDQSFRLMAEYEFSNYSKNDRLTFNGELNGLPNAALNPYQLSEASLQQNWNDQHVGRLGFEYRPSPTMKLRAGYAYTSRVTSKQFARATFASPGEGHGVTLGSGFTFAEIFDLDLAIDRSWAAGTVEAADVTAASGTRTGRYDTSAWGLHAGATVRL